MGVSLKYNLSEYKSSTSNIETLKSSIETSKNTMIDGLEQIRKDYTADGGQAFFNSIDTDWVDSIQTCINVLDDLLDALNQSYDKYNLIEDEASNDLKF